MGLQITGINIDLTPALRHYVERKLSKLNRHFPNIIETKVDISKEKTKSPQQQFIVQSTVAGSGAQFHSEERGRDLFQAIDKLADTMIRQLEQYKGKLYERGRGSSFARGEFSAETEAVTPAPEVVKVKRFIMKSMTLAEAAEQMSLLGHNFFLFLNADTKELNLLYERKDGNYGLIEPELG